MDAKDDSNNEGGQTHLIDLDKVQLAHINRLTELGISSASLLHELRQPLVAIKGYAEMMLADPSIDDPRLRKLHSAAKNMHRLISHHIHFSKATGGEKVDIDINSPFEEALTMLSFRFKRSPSKIIKHFSQDVAPVRASSLALQQVFSNLLINSIDACISLPKFSLWVMTRNGSDGCVEAFVGDNGPGVSEDNQTNIFQHFFTSKGEEGTGLGLPISREIASNHGGSLELINKRATIQAIFPLEPASSSDVPNIVFRLRLPAN